MNIAPSRTIDVNTFLPTFGELKDRYPELYSLIVTNVPKTRFDLGDPETLRTLNHYMLKAVTGLEISVPKEFLIPAVGNRIAYCDIVASLNLSNKPILEIGTGASAIIAMILAKRYNRNVVATEINPTSFESAKKNIKNNKLDDKIRLVLSEGEIINDLLNHQSFSALVCYPPIYSLRDDTKVFKKKGWKGHFSELIGGKSGLEFVYTMFDEAINEDIVDIDFITVMLMNKHQAQEVYTQYYNNVSDIELVQLLAGTRKRFVLILKK